jgi:CRP-like cAMP-binding protein
VLDADPELGAALDDDAFRVARRVFVASVHRAPRGAWAPGAPTGRACAGLLVLEGLITHAVEIGARRGLELLAEGDVIQPSVPADRDAAIAVEETWRVITPTRFAVLDADFLAVAARFPQIYVELMLRMGERTTRLAVQAAISETQGIEARVRMLLWFLAERWGKVGSSGVALDLPLPHETIGEVIGACRSSVTAAVNDLVRMGELHHPRRRIWILLGAPPGIESPDLEASADSDVTLATVV